MFMTGSPFPQEPRYPQPSSALSKSTLLSAHVWHLTCTKDRTRLFAALYESFGRAADKPDRTQEDIQSMIALTRLNGQAMVVNSDLIKYVESSPDTMLTLIHGEKVVVSEPCEEVVRRITAYRAMLLRNVVMQASEATGADIANAAASAAGLRAMTAERATRVGELPHEFDDTAQQRRRRNED